MNTPITAETVLPRPAEPLPPPALATATRKLTDKLTDLFNMSEDAAQALALAVVDPSAARRAAENPERLSVPGGVILAVRAEVWARYIIPDPRNPRIGPARRHPVSTLVGRGESTRLRPLAEPKAAAEGRAELVQEIQNQEHLAWAAQQARDYVISNNDWRDSIKNQGVMTEVWLTATTFQHLDGSPGVTIPVTAEGSSRVTCVHDLLDLRSADVPYDRDERKFRAHIRKLNEEISAAGTPDQVEPHVAIMARCEKVPALLLVGFESHGGITTDFGIAVKSLVALRHVDYPKPWGEATENEALADAIIDELERRRLITPAKANWLAGALTPDEAETAGFNSDPTVRAATIVQLFTDNNPRTYTRPCGSRSPARAPARRPARSCYSTWRPRWSCDPCRKKTPAAASGSAGTSRSRSATSSLRTSGRRPSEARKNSLPPPCLRPSLAVQARPPVSSPLAALTRSSSTGSFWTASRDTDQPSTGASREK